MSYVNTAWFRDTHEAPLFINETVVRIRAGLMMFIPIFMAFTLFDVLYTPAWLVDVATLEDAYKVNEASQVIHTAEVVMRAYDYTWQSGVLVYALFELLAGMSVKTARFSPSIQLASWLARYQPAVWKPMAPKRFAWSLGLVLASFCWVFFNPDTFAGWVNTVFMSEVLPTTYNYIPYEVPVTLLYLCLAMMWLEVVLGFCVGCKIHSLLVWLNWIEEPCYACNNIDWDAIRAKNASKTS